MDNYAADQRTPFKPDVCIHNLPLYMHCDECVQDSRNVTTTNIPTTQEQHIMNLDANDANAVSSFFQSLADKVVLASTLPKEVAELRAVVDKLKADVEAYREHNARMDEEITNLRRERQALQDENAQLRSALLQKTDEHNIAETRWGQACQERDRWHNDYIQLSQTHEDAKRERDDAQMKIMELEDTVRRMGEDNARLINERNGFEDKLSSIRSTLA